MDALKCITISFGHQSYSFVINTFGYNDPPQLTLLQTRCHRLNYTSKLMECVKLHHKITSFKSRSDSNMKSCTVNHYKHYICISKTIAYDMISKIKKKYFQKVYIKHGLFGIYQCKWYYSYNWW